MTVYPQPRAVAGPADAAWPALLVALAGCVALAARPGLAWPSIAVTMAVGTAGALAPAAPDGDRGAGVAWLAAVALGVGGFASIRLASAIPPAPGGARMVSLAVVAAIAEELFFRRFLYAALLRRGAGVAIAASALAFALVHVPAYGAAVFPLDLAAGLVLSWQRWATGSWTASAASHAAANLMAIL